MKIEPQSLTTSEVAPDGNTVKVARKHRRQGSAGTAPGFQQSEVGGAGHDIAGPADPGPSHPLRRPLAPIRLSAGVLERGAIIRSKNRNGDAVHHGRVQRVLLDAGRAAARAGRPPFFPPFSPPPPPPPPPPGADFVHFSTRSVAVVLTTLSTPGPFPLPPSSSVMHPADPPSRSAMWHSRIWACWRRSWSGKGGTSRSAKRLSMISAIVRSGTPSLSSLSAAPIRVYETDPRIRCRVGTGAARIPGLRTIFHAKDLPWQPAHGQGAWRTGLQRAGQGNRLGRDRPRGRGQVILPGRSRRRGRGRSAPGMETPSICLRMPGGWRRTLHCQNQAFAYRGNALALQFHLEADPRRLEQWYVGHAAELATAKVSVRELRAEALRHKDGLAPRADRVFGNWLRRISVSNMRRQPKVKA